jgi:hypothetical protein
MRKQAISRELPPNHMMNPARPWVSSKNTDIAATFARIRAQQVQPAQQRASAQNKR